MESVEHLVARLQGGGAAGDKKLKSYTMAQVAEHNSPTDLWLVVEDKVYDVTKWAKHHPGGLTTLHRFAGKDATDEMRAFHPDNVIEKKLPLFMIGTVSDPPVATPLQKDFRKLHQQFADAGYFQPDLMYYYKKAAILGPMFLGVFYLVLFTSSDLLHMLAAFMLAVFWWQIAFVGHDLGHMSVTYDRLKDYEIGFVLANLLTGISVGWWKATHNVHHAVPNSLHDDPDIQHMPMIAIDSQFFDSVYSTYHKRVMALDWAAKNIFIPVQHYLYYPIMAVARFNLYAQSLIRLVKEENALFRTREIIMLAGFYTWYIFLMTQLNSNWMRLWFTLMSHGASGILEVQITLSHFPKEVFDGKQQEDGRTGNSVYGGDFYSRNVKSSLDVDCYEFMDWFHGGLQFQTLHHMFPRLHRSKLRTVQPVVREMCRKHGLEYDLRTFWEGNKAVIRTLKHAATELKTWSPHINESFNAQG